MNVTIEDLNDAGVVIPTPSPLTYLSRKQMDLGEWQWIIINLVRWWLQLQLLFQMWFCCLSKLIYLLIAVMQSFICQIYFCHSYKERPSETLLSDDKFRNKHLLPYFRNTSTLKVIEKIKETKGWFFEKIALLKL